MDESKPIITLKGKTLKGKNRVRELGDQWRIIRIAPAAEPEQYLIESVKDPRAVRWINIRNDPDFEKVRE